MIKITGWAHSQFSKHDDLDTEGLIAAVARDAIEDAKLEPEAVDAIFLGWYNGGFSDQDFGSSLALHALPELRFTPATRVENACATGSAAVHQAANLIEAGRAQTILVIGVEKMTARSGDEIGRILLQASYLKEEGDIQGGFAGAFARIAQGYFQKYGDQSDALAHIAVKNHQNGLDNPYAQMRKALSYDFCRFESEKNPIVSAPLKRTDCSLVSDGAAALILQSGDQKSKSDKAVNLRARAQVNDYLAMSKRDMTFMEGCAKAWSQALTEAELTLEELDFVETHDCFTIAELMQYEAMGLTKRGQGAKALTEGWVYSDGKLPVNRSGGLKAKGHPIGATGVSMHVMSAMQLCDQAGDMQINKQGSTPKIGGIFNMGGAGVANYCSILTV